MTKKAAPLPQESVFAFIDKPEGWTSHDCVNYLRKAFPQSKMGHGGTLDPFATGILPIFFGQWTRLSQLFTHADKRYQAELVLGARTDTGDLTGKVVQKGQQHAPAMSFQLLEKSLFGPIKLPVPIYSALKVGGTPMHALARRGELKEPARYRRTTIYDIALTQPQGDRIGIDVLCSHGTYVRSLGEHIASRLKTCGHLGKLRRVEYYRNGTPYNIPMATPEDFVADPQKYIVGLSRLAEFLPIYQISVSEVRSCLTGKWRRAPLKLEGWRLIQSGNSSLAVVFFERGKITQRIFLDRPALKKDGSPAKKLMKLSCYD